MDRLSLAIAVVALLLFAALVVVASVMTSVSPPPKVSCTGPTVCPPRPWPRPTYDSPIPRFSPTNRP